MFFLRFSYYTTPVGLPRVLDIDKADPSFTGSDEKIIMASMNKINNSTGITIEYTRKLFKVISFIGWQESDILSIPE
jgi:hypothetical protein